MHRFLTILRRLCALPALRYFDQFQPNARLFLLATVINGITLSGFQLFFNIYLEARSFDRDFIGLLNALPSAASLVVGVPLGVLADRLGARRAMLSGVGVATVAAWVLIASPSPEVMIATSVVMGAANTLYYLSMAPFMMKSSGARERTLLFSLNFGLTTISGAVGNTLAGQLPGWFAAWLGVSAESAAAYQAVLLANVLGGGLSILPMWLIREGRWPGPHRTAAFGLRDFVHLLRPGIFRIALPNLLIGFGAALLIPYLNLFFKNVHQVNDAALGVLYSLGSLSVGVATLIGPKLAEALDSKVRAVVATQALSIVFLLLLGFAPNVWLAGLAFLVRGALMNMSNPLYSSFVMEQTVEHERATVNSVLTLMWQAGWAVGLYLSGVVQAGYGFAPLFITTAALYAVATALMWLFFGQAEAQPKPVAR
ncbi:MAG: MFS transporter [Anaerolineales bacterium]|nr:MFS transporter [Anaerolineales bacterium]